MEEHNMNDKCQQHKCSRCNGELKLERTDNDAKDKQNVPIYY